MQRAINGRPRETSHPATLMRRLTLSGTKRFGDHRLRSYISSAPTHNFYMMATACRTSSSSCDSASTKLEPLLGPKMGLPMQLPLQRCRALGKSRRDVISVLEQGKDTLRLSLSITYPSVGSVGLQLECFCPYLRSPDSHLSPHSVRDNSIGGPGIFRQHTKKAID